MWVVVSSLASGVLESVPGEGEVPLEDAVPAGADVDVVLPVGVGGHDPPPVLMSSCHALRSRPVQLRHLQLVKGPVMVLRRLG